VSGSHSLANTAGGVYESGIHERPSGAFRLPEQRPAAAPYAVPDPVSSTGSHARPAEPEVRNYAASVRGTEYPTVRTPEKVEVPAPVASMAEPTSLVPPVTAPRFEQVRPAENVYSTRRPVSSFVVAIVMVVLLIPIVRLLASATFAGSPTARAVVPAVLLTLGFALSGIGLFAVAGGRPLEKESWLRPPVAYLPAGLILLLAAGLAVA
jgi:hypothetical protein